MGYTFAWPPPVHDGEDLTIAAQKVLDETIGQVFESLRRSVHVTARVGYGHPAQMLPKVAEGALMLVVSSRGHGMFSDRLLGSVSQHCAQHAPCPVVVVPTTEQADAA